MPNIKSAKKRVDVSEKSKLVNKAYKSELATALKKFNAAASAQDKDLVKKLYPETVAIIDESVSRGVIHKNKADRKKADVSSKFIAVQTAKKKKAEPKEEKVEEAKVEEVKVEEKPKRASKPKAAAEEKPKKTAKAKAEKVESAETEAKPKRAKKTEKAEK